jgi:hypothetical protein
LKRQKEQKRMARQAAKREARLERKKERLEDQNLVPLEDLLGEKLDTDSNPEGSTPPAPASKEESAGDQ